jgi:hypothetical protein
MISSILISVEPKVDEPQEPSLKVIQNSHSLIGIGIQSSIYKTYNAHQNGTRPRLDQSN